MVGPARDAAALGQEGGLVVQRGVRQAQRDQVVNGVDVGHPLGFERQGGGPVHHVRAAFVRAPGALAGEAERRDGAMTGEGGVGVAEQVARGPEEVGLGHSPRRARPDHLSGRADRPGGAAEAARIDAGVPGQPGRLLGLGRVDQGDLVQDRTLPVRRAGTVEDLRPQADRLDIGQQVTPVGGDARTLRQGQVKAVDADGFHTEPVFDTHPRRTPAVSHRAESRSTACRVQAQAT